MRRRTGFEIVLTIFLLASSMMFFGVEVPDVNASTLFRHDFGDLTGWHTLDGVWTVSGGVLTGTVPDTVKGMVWVGETSWMDYTSTADLRIDNSGDEASLVIRYVDPGNFYWLGLGCWGHKYSIAKFVSGSPQKLASSGLASEVEVGRWYTVSAVAVEDTLQLLVDGVKVLEVQDGSHPNGAVGFRTWDGKMLARQITVQAIDTPLFTVHNYDGLWNTADFTVTLTASDDYTWVSDTYYRINDGVTRRVTVNGQPVIDTEGANNKLEYWSVDSIGREELPHNILTGIKLDKTGPTGSVVINNGDASTSSASVTLSLTYTDATSGVSHVRYSNDGVWDTESWEAPATTKPWTLTSGDGTKTVYYQIKNLAELTSSSYSDTILMTTGVQDEPFPLWILGAAVAFSAALAIIGVATRSKRAKGMTAAAKVKLPQSEEAELKLEKERIVEMLEDFEDKYEKGEITRADYEGLKSKYEGKLKEVENKIKAWFYKEYFATARSLAKLEELRASGTIDEETYQKLKQEYESKLNER